jgi:salicylate hydroxylase
MKLGSAIEARHGAPYLTLHRADLHAGLTATAISLDAVTLHRHVDVRAANARADGVTVHTADDGEIDGTCLIGADGLWSRIRATIAPRAVLRFTGATAWRTLLPRRGLPAPFDQPDVGLWLGPSSHLVHYPVRGGEALNVVAVVEGGAAREGWAVAADPASLRPAFAKWAEAARSLLACAESWRCWSLYRLPPLRRWTNGRIALIGDAAHPVLPYLAQGAGLAIEDAATLAACLADRPDDPATAFSRYAALRRPRARRLQAQAWRYGRFYHLSGMMARARNAVLTRRQPETLLAGLDWLYADGAER